MFGRNPKIVTKIWEKLCWGGTWGRVTERNGPQSLTLGWWEDLAPVSTETLSPSLSISAEALLRNIPVESLCDTVFND